jgi:hypothetical protein
MRAFLQLLWPAFRLRTSSVQGSRDPSKLLRIGTFHRALGAPGYPRVFTSIWDTLSSPNPAPTSMDISIPARCATVNGSS